MRRYTLSQAALGAMAGCLVLAAPAWAQDEAIDPASTIDWKIGGSAVLAGGLYDADGVDPSGLVGRAEGWLTGSTLFDNQVEVGVALGFVAEGDNPRNDPRGDADGPFASGCSPFAVGCVGAPIPTYRSIHAAFAEGGVAADRGGRAQLETAYVYVSGPLGEVAVGRQEGVAARFALRPNRGAAALAAADPKLDLTGLGAPRVRDTISGPSAKITATTARVLGVQAGVSYTPGLEAAGVDAAKRFGPERTVGALPGAIWEAGLSFSLRPPGWPNVAASLTHSRASADVRQAEFGAIETTSASVAIADDTWSLGIAALEGDNGWIGAGERTYRSVAVHGGIDLDAWSLGLEIATSADDLTRTDWESAVGTAAFAVSESLSVTLGLQSVERRPATGSVLRPKRHTQGAFVEFSAKF